LKLLEDSLKTGHFSQCGQQSSIAKLQQQKAQLDDMVRSRCHNVMVQQDTANQGVNPFAGPCDDEFNATATYISS